MAAADLAERMTRCLNRTMALCDGMLESYGALEMQLGAEEFSELLEKQQRHSRELAVLRTELDGLIREWQTQPSLGETEREHIAQLAAIADERIQSVATLSEQGAAEASRRIGTLTDAMAELRKGRDMLRSYRAGEDTRPDYMDREA